MNHAGPLLVDRSRAVVGRWRGCRQGRGANGCCQSFQQYGRLRLVLLFLTFQRASQPALYGLLDLRGRRRFLQHVGLLAGVKALHHLLHVHADGGLERGQAAAVLVDAQGEVMEKGLAAELAAVGAVLVAVEAAVKLQVDVLGELGVADLALVRFLSRMQA